jgi:hypothetical protein
MSKMFVHYSGTIAAFKAAGLESTYNKHIVFIKGGENGDGAAIYTHGKYYGDVKDALAALEGTVNGLKYFTSIKAGDKTASATGKDGVITFNAADPALVSVDVDSHGVNIGLSKTFTDSVAANTANIAGEVTRATEAEGKIRADLGQKTDAADAAGSAFARIAKVVADIEAMTGGNGSIADQIKAAIEKLDVDEISGDYIKSVKQVDGKIEATVGTFNFDEAGAADAALEAAKAYADGLAGNYDAAGSAADAQEAAIAHADGLNTAMDNRVKVLEAIDHNKIATDAAAAAVAGVMDDAPEKFDTLKEIAAWIAEADTAEDAASLVTRVSALEAIDHDAYKGYADQAEADAIAAATELNNATNARVKAIEDDYLTSADKGELEGKINNKVDSSVYNAKVEELAGATTAAEAAAKKHADDAIAALDVEDAAVENQFVTAVSETDGKISVSRSAISASQIGITNTEADAFAAETTNVQAALTELASFWMWEEL